MMTIDNQVCFKGQLLMAMPELHDPNFYRSVTCISEHTSQGAVGIVVTQVHPVLSAGLIFEELDIKYTDSAGDLPIYIGGPVHYNEIFVLHGPPFDWINNHIITNDLALSNSRDIMSAIASGKGPEYFMISLGCAGWGAGQLENELMENIWLTSPYSKKIIFDLPIKSRWKEAIKMIGIDPALLSHTAGHA